MESLSPKANFLAEVDGQVVLSNWRVRLLEAVAETGSVTGAAHELGIQYRLAWDRVHEMEQHLGQQLVDTQIGGPGGGAQLTPTAKDCIRRWHEFSSGLGALVAERFAAAFHELP